MRTTPPDPKYPRVYVDFNACGWAGGEDRCYYAYDRAAVQKFSPEEGAIVCAYMESDERSVIGCLAYMERYDDGWRFREIADSWFEVRNELLNAV